jgi:hypothetical protein
MRWTVLTLITLVFMGGASSCLPVNRIAHHIREAWTLKQRNDVPDFLGERLPKRPAYLQPAPTRCAEEEQSPFAVIQVGCGAGRSRPEQLALRSASPSLHD